MQVIFINNYQLDNRDHEKVMQFIMSMQEYSTDFRLRIMQYLSSIFSFDYITFLLVDEEEKFTDLIATNISEKLLKLYTEYYFKTDIFHPRNYPPHFSSNKNVVTITDLMPFNQYENTEFYRDFLKVENFYYQAALYLRKNNRLIGAVGIIRNKDSGDFTKKELDILNMLTPLISIRFSNYLEIMQIKREHQIYTNCMKQLPSGIILLDNKYSVLSYNELALEYCKDIQNSRKSAADPVKEVIKNVFSNLCFQVNDSTISIYSSHECYKLSIKPIIIPNIQKGIETCFIIYINSSLTPGNTKYYTLRSNYNLTERELEIIELIAQGLNNKEIAVKLCISYNTVRTHVENILTKMNVTNRTAILHKLRIV